MSRDDDKRKASIERAKTSGKTLVALGLNAILPGSGTPAVRLGEHVAGLVLQDRLAKLDDFHRRVFEGDVSEQEVNNRFKALDEDADFRHLVATMLADIDEEKTPIYAAVYIHLVENNQTIERVYKRQWISAVENLQHHDLWVLKQLVDGRWHEEYSDAEHRLASAGAVTLHTGFSSAHDPDRSNVSAKPTTFGRELIEVVAGALGHD